MSEHDSTIEEIRESLRYFPTTPGVYIMKDSEGKTIYVGKARNLRNRVKSYFSGRKDPKTTVLISHVNDIEHIVCRNEYEALLLENSLIKKHQPRYNINLKDGKTYPVIRVTNEKYPRVFRTRRVVHDGSTYYGPYTKVWSIDAYLELIEQLFPLRKCRGAVKPRPKPCLYYHLGRCTAVCAGKTDHATYMEHVENIKRLLSGEREQLISELTEQMHEAGRALDFERAAHLRDTITAIENLAEEQQVIDHDPDVRDYVGVARRDQMASFVVFQMRGGKLLGSDMFRTEVFASEQEDLVQFLLQYYSEVRTPPARLFLPIPVEAAQIRAFFADELGAEVSIETPAGAGAAAGATAGADQHTPAAGETDDAAGAGPAAANQENPAGADQHTPAAGGTGDRAGAGAAAGDTPGTNQGTPGADQHTPAAGAGTGPDPATDARTASIINMATENARQDLERRIRDSGNLPALEELQKALGLSSPPYRIEGFDIAHIGGKHTVASLVSFHNGVPDPPRYRSFNIRSLDGGIDDFEAMREVIARRYTRVKNEKQPRPDLILIDGGRGQVSAATEILESLEMNDIPVVGLAKKREELFLADKVDPVVLPEGAAPLKILQYVRDEAHRFATSKRSGKQSRELAMTVLEGVPGLGPKRLRALLEAFGSPAEIRKRSAGEIAAGANIPVNVAHGVVDALGGTGEAANDDGEGE